MSIVLEGKVISGLGDFSKRMSQIPGLLDVYFKKTGLCFFPGTLNIELNEPWSVPVNSMRLEKEEYGGTVSVNIVPCRFFDRKAFILRTDKNESGTGHHSKRIIEIASDIKLRDKYKLNDNDIVKIIIE